MSSTVSIPAISTPYYNQPYQRNLASSLTTPGAYFPATSAPFIRTNTPYPFQYLQGNFYNKTSAPKSFWQRAKQAWSSETTLGKVLLGAAALCIIDFPLELIQDIRKGFQEARKRQVIRDLGNAAEKSLDGDYGALSDKNLIKPWYKILKDVPLKSVFRFYTLFSAGAAVFSLLEMIAFIKKINPKPQLEPYPIAPLASFSSFQNQSSLSGSPMQSA